MWVLKSYTLSTLYLNHEIVLHTFWSNYYSFLDFQLVKIYIILLSICDVVGSWWKSRWFFFIHVSTNKAFLLLHFLFPHAHQWFKGHSVSLIKLPLYVSIETLKRSRKVRVNIVGLIGQGDGPWLVVS